MKLLPWVLVALLAIAVAGLWAGRPKTTGVSDPEPLAPSARDSEPTGESPSRTTPLQADSIEALTEEVRGLRTDLKRLLAEEREPVGENDLTAELRRLITALEQNAVHSQNRSSVSVGSVSLDGKEPVLLDLRERTHSSPEETKRSYLLRSQQEILEEFGVPGSVSKSSAGYVTWGYDVEEPNGDSHYIGITFIDGMVSSIHTSD